MLSDRERETLDDIQRRLQAEDPAFAESFTTTSAQRQRRSPGLPRQVYTVMAVLSAAFAVLGLMVGSPSSALVLTAVAALIVGARRRLGRGHNGGDAMRTGPNGR